MACRASWKSTSSVANVTLRSIFASPHVFQNGPGWPRTARAETPENRDHKRHADAALTILAAHAV
jgi:hypothetical protein